MQKFRITSNRIKTLFQNLSKIRILVIGDLILDRYLLGKVERISPEAPVPVVWVQSEKQTLGGAGNVIANLASLGVESVIIGRIGADSNGEVIRNLLHLKNSTPFLVIEEEIPTTVKTRILAGNQQLCRVDRESIEPLGVEYEIKIIEEITDRMNEIDAVVMSDYDKGLFTSNLIEKSIEIANQKNKPIVVDPQISHFFHYRKTYSMTPNHHEAGKALGRSLNSELDVSKALFEIRNRLQSESVMITRGDKGISILPKGSQEVVHIPTVAKEVFDVTGAGDTVISLYTSFLACGATDWEATVLSNAGAGLVVGKLGAASITADELLKEIQFLGILE